ncbi:MAG: prephenate dehydratase [Pseudomonadota bacterium]|nr:prephenate dehydratase [Pseudomonadota bacterium]
MDEKALKGLREQIDTIDRRLRALLNERAACAIKVADIKSATGEATTTPFYRPEREAQIIERLRSENEGPLSDDSVERLFREVISCCLSLEQPIKIAYLGPSGTYTEAATIRQFGHFAKTSPLSSIDEVFREVESGSAHYGVVPVENSTEGMVNHTLDCFMATSLNICGEVELPIHHVLLASAGTEQDEIDCVYSHEQSLAQCRRWLDTHLPNVERRPVASNAEAAKLAGEVERSAAIAGEVAGDRYGLIVLQQNIEDLADNTTRFLVIGDQDVGPSGSDKTSILVSTRDEPGALFKVLEPFHRGGISLSRIETRPARSTNWSYVFFIDFDGHQSSGHIAAVLDEVRSVALEVRSLGSYPQAVGR